MKPLAKVLKDKLTEKELELVPRSYDIIGSRKKSVAIVEIPKELESKKQLIGEAILRLNKNIKSVLSKLSGRRGVFRTEDLELIAGEEDTEVIHKEYGCLIKLDPRKVFFSPRELTERQRIAGQVKAGETILVMFGGTGVYSLRIGKIQPNVEKIISVEINPDAVKYMKDNIQINKLSHKIVPLLGDVRNICPKYYGKCDRVIMPFAVGGWKYLDIAFMCLKPSGGVIHFYYIAPESDLFSEGKEKIEEVANKLNKEFLIIDKKNVLPFGSRMFKIVLDILIC